MQRHSPIFLSVLGTLQISSLLLCPSGCRRSPSSQIASQKREGFSLSQAQTLGEKNPALLLSAAQTCVNSELFYIKQRSRKGQQAPLAVPRHRQLLFPLPFLLLFSLPDASQTPRLQWGAEEQQISEWSRHTEPPQPPGGMVCHSPCALKLPEIPRALLQPPALTCPQIPQGLCSDPVLH